MSLYSYGKSGVRTKDTSTTDGLKKALRALRDGTLSFMDFKVLCTIEGRVFTASCGSAASPATFRTTYASKQPELCIDVPANTCIIPLAATVVFSASAGTVNGWTSRISPGNTGAGTSTAITAATIWNNATDKPNATLCSVYKTYSADGTDLTNPVEIARGYYAFADTSGDPHKIWKWSALTDTPAFLVGTATWVFNAYATTTAATGYIDASWIELPSNLFV